MWECPKCQESCEDSLDACWNCGTGRDGTPDPDFEPINKTTHDTLKLESMLLTTSARFETAHIRGYLGVVGGETVIKPSSLSAFMATVVGVQGELYEGPLQNARQTALEEMARRAEALKANAVVGVAFQYVSLDEMLLVTCSGTAVQVEMRTELDE